MCALRCQEVPLQKSNDVQKNFVHANIEFLLLKWKTNKEGKN